MESGPFIMWGSFQMDFAQNQFDQIVHNVNCSDSEAGQVACLRSLSMEAMLAVSSNLNSDAATNWAPVVDGVELTDTPENLASQGKIANVPVMVGTNLNEGTNFMPDYIRNMTAAQYPQFLIQEYGTKVGTELAILYPVSAYESVWWAMDHIWTDLSMRCGARRTARWSVDVGNPTYLYLFQHEPWFLKLDPYVGVCHGSELFFVFNQEGALIDAPEIQLARNMVTYWTNFAIYGNPNGNMTASASKSTLAFWPLYDAVNDQNQILDLNISTGTGLDKDMCDYWDSLYFEGCLMYPCPCSCNH